MKKKGNAKGGKRKMKSKGGAMGGKRKMMSKGGAMGGKRKMMSKGGAAGGKTPADVAKSFQDVQEGRLGVKALVGKMVKGPYS
tara:strand:+ start:462 stop:710 length:249 start_codon:yes stop_codon:yes gene_type:complete